ncbi:MAG: hypothetical protein HC930_12730 [Hydrococcus sp. SU_1_0]|nr:hypothetical protein [Hydrococcus sp. SU_1_0]
MTEKLQAESTLTDRYQTTIPDIVRKTLGLNKWDKIAYVINSDGTITISRSEASKDDPIEENNKPVLLHNQKQFGMRMIGEPDSDYDYFSANWNGLIFFCDCGELFSFPSKSYSQFEIHVVYGVDCAALNEKIAMAIRDKKYEQSDILSVVGHNNELVLFDSLMSLSEACKSSEIKMVIWFDEKLDFDDRLAGLNQTSLNDYHMLHMSLFS